LAAPTLAIGIGYRLKAALVQKRQRERLQIEQSDAFGPTVMTTLPLGSGLATLDTQCRGKGKFPLNRISHFRKLLIALRFAFATQAITAASSVNPNTGTPSGIRSNGLTK
jgi:hypothetical protein